MDHPRRSGRCSDVISAQKKVELQLRVGQPEASRRPPSCWSSSAHVPWRLHRPGQSPSRSITPFADRVSAAPVGKSCRSALIDYYDVDHFKAVQRLLRPSTPAIPLPASIKPVTPTVRCVGQVTPARGMAARIFRHAHAPATPIEGCVRRRRAHLHPGRRPCNFAHAPSPFVTVTFSIGIAEGHPHAVGRRPCDARASRGRSLLCRQSRSPRTVSASTTIGPPGAEGPVVSARSPDRRCLVFGRRSRSATGPLSSPLAADITVHQLDDRHRRHVAVTHPGPQHPRA